MKECQVGAQPFLGTAVVVANIRHRIDNHFPVQICNAMRKTPCTEGWLGPRLRNINSVSAVARAMPHSSGLNSRACCSASCFRHQAEGSISVALASGPCAGRDPARWG